MTTACKVDKDYFLKRLSVSKPSFFERYSYDQLPATFHCRDTITIECREHGDYTLQAYTHLNGSGCRVCGRLRTTAANKARQPTTDEFVSKSRALFGSNFSYTKTRYENQDTSIMLTCQYHGDVVMTPREHYRSKFGCSQCDYERPRAASRLKVLALAREIHANKYDYSRVNFVNVNDPVEITCPLHGSFWQGLYQHTKKRTGCPACALASNRLSVSDFIARAQSVHGNRYDYTKVVYKDSDSKVTIVCPVHGEFTQRAHSHLSGCKCKKCHAEKQRTSKEEFIKTARVKHGDAYDYSRVVYRGNKIPVEIVCLIHGSFWQKPNTHSSSGNGCKFCSESKGEKAIEVCLKRYGLEHIREHRILPYRYRYDFYIPGASVYIEFHGVQHYRPVDIFGGRAGYLSTVERDREKARLVKERGDCLVVLTYKDLSADSVEDVLLRELRRCFSRWYKVGGRLMVFRRVIDAYKHFGIPLHLPKKDLETEIRKNTKSLEVLLESSL